MRKNVISAVLVVITALIVGRQASADGVLVVGTCPGGTFSTIQNAVDAAASMSGEQTIRVCPGIYPENVVIGSGNSVKIVGQGTDKTFVTGVPGTAGPIIHVMSAGTVGIEKLTVDGGSALADHTTVWGIRYETTDGKIKDVKVLNIRDATGTSTGNGIQIDPGPANVTVEHSLVQNFTRRGIYANHPDVEVDIKNNTVIGPSAPTLTVNGIQISRGARGDVKHNAVSRAADPSPPGGVAGTGILVFCAGPTKVEQNKVSSSEIGIGIADNQDAEVKHNKVSEASDALSLQFLGRATFGSYLDCTKDPNPSPTTGNVFEHNEVVNSTLGVVFEQPAPEPDWLPSHDAFVGNRISHNKITGSAEDGIQVPWGHDNVFHDNKVFGSPGPFFDIHDTTTGGGTAGTANTWTKNKCETSSPTGLCE